MIKELNKKYLITSNNWFIAPDGEQYKAIYGTVTAIESDSDTMGIKTNRGSTNWYVRIGNMVIAGCQVFFAIRSDDVSDNPPQRCIEHEGKPHYTTQEKSFIYFADKIS